MVDFSIFTKYIEWYEISNFLDIVKVEKKSKLCNVPFTFYYYINVIDLVNLLYIILICLINYTDSV